MIVSRKVEWRTLARLSASIGFTCLLVACGGGGGSSPPASSAPAPYVPPPPPPPPEPFMLSLEARPVVGKEDWLVYNSLLYGQTYDCVVNGITDLRCQIPASGAEYDGAIQAWFVIKGDALKYSIYVSDEDIIEGGFAVTWHGHEFVFPLAPVPSGQIFYCSSSACHFAAYVPALNFGPGRLWKDPTSGTYYAVWVDNMGPVGPTYALRIRYQEYADGSSKKVKNRHYLFVDGDYLME